MAVKEIYEGSEWICFTSAMVSHREKNGEPPWKEKEKKNEKSILLFNYLSWYFIIQVVSLRYFFFSFLFFNFFFFILFFLSSSIYYDAPEFKADVMHFIRLRFVDILSTTLMGFCLLGVLAAGSTIVRNALVHPVPHISGTTLEDYLHGRTSPTAWLTTIVTKPVEAKVVYQQLPNEPSKSLYYISRPEELTWLLNVEKQHAAGNAPPPPPPPLVVPSLGKIELPWLRKNRPSTPPRKIKGKVIWEPNLLQPTDLALEYKNKGIFVLKTDRARIAVSGRVDFSDCWDWNTKAIYASFVAIYATPAIPHNEVALSDVVLRPPPRISAIPPVIQPLVASLKKTANTTGTRRWTHEQRQAFQDYLVTLRNEHDSVGAIQDPFQKLVYFNKTEKYDLEDYYSGFLSGTKVKIVMRYQVMSYSGWAPLKELVVSENDIILQGEQEEFEENENEALGSVLC